MPFDGNTSGNLSANLHLYYVKKALETAQPRLNVYPLGMKVPFPKGLGKQVKWLVYSKINPNTTPLSEGEPPTPTLLSSSNVTATMSQYGQLIKVTDVLSYTAIDNVIESASKQLGNVAAETVEDLCIAELDSAAFIQRVNDRANDDAIVAGDVISHKEILEAVSRAKNDGVRAHESGSFICVLHPACEYDLLTDTSTGSVLDIRKFSQPDKLNGEIGSLYGVRFLLSDKMTAANNSGGVSVKKNYIIGNEAFGVVSIDPKNFQMYIKTPKEIGGPLEQYGTVSFKIMGFACKFLHANSKRVTQIRCASALG